MINRTILQGRLTATPEIRTTQSGHKVAKFTVAWNEKYGDKETNLFLNCTAWNGTAEFVCKYFAKGQQIIVEGKLQTNSFTDKEGNNRSVIDLSVDGVSFCGSKGDNSSATAPAEIKAESIVAPSYDSVVVPVIEEDDYPFD